MKLRKQQRAFTLFEMVVAMLIMGIVMSFAALEFRAVVFTYLDADSHLSAEQQARVALAKVNDLARQATVIDNAGSANSPQPAIIQPGSTPGPMLRFSMVQSLAPQSMPTPNGYPQPCYDYVTISIPAAAVPGTSSDPHNLIEQIEPVDPTRSVCTQNETYGSRILARNVEDFTVQQAEPCNPTTQKCTPFGQGYRIDISTFDYDDNAADSHAGALYHLSSVITPLTFGVSE
ncbi:MAG TPA: type II secretion system protein [Candidatus Eremiobacteraceae bacterium]|nr:type II secretion system protein [Candidatus Eremiobacteraceae bacterium]